MYGQGRTDDPSDLPVGRASMLRLVVAAVYVRDITTYYNTLVAVLYFSVTARERFRFELGCTRGKTEYVVT